VQLQGLWRQVRKNVKLIAQMLRFQFHHR
jgi:hypothetical protein